MQAVDIKKINRYFMKVIEQGEKVIKKRDFYPEGLEEKKTKGLTQDQ